MQRCRFFTLPAELRNHIYFNLMPTEKYNSTSQDQRFCFRGLCRQFKREYEHELIKIMHKYAQGLPAIMREKYGLTATVDLQNPVEMTFVDTTRLSVSFDASTSNSLMYIPTVDLGDTEKFLIKMHSHVRSVAMRFHLPYGTAVGRAHLLRYINNTIVDTGDFVGNQPMVGHNRVVDVTVDWKDVAVDPYMRQELADFAQTHGARELFGVQDIFTDDFMMVTGARWVIDDIAYAKGQNL